MAWRFKASKYKNSTPIVPKPELCIREIVVGSYQTFGNNIAASASFMAFNWDHAGSSLAVLPIDDCGRKSKTMPLLQAHSDTVTYMNFSPFYDNILATASQDGLIKLWQIPEDGLKESISNAECSFSKQKRIESVLFHPTADFLLSSASSTTISLFDLTEQKEVFSNSEHSDVIQSVSWKQDGTVLTTNAKDKKIRVIDPRSSEPLVMEAESHQNIKDSRIVWLGNQNRILTTGFDANRIRQVMIRDIRNFDNPEKVLNFDCSTGILMPLFDPDTNMLFLAGKGDTTISFWEITDKDPFFVEGIRHSGEQTKGACLLPKRCLRVMDAEINRVLQLTSSSVIPIMYQVPRKSFRDFHSDIFPDTDGYKSQLTPKSWLSGKNRSLDKMSLDPAKRENGDKPIVVTLKGSVKETMSNLNNLVKSATDTKKPLVNAKPNYVPVKEKIHFLENDQKSESDEFYTKHKFIAKKLIEHENLDELCEKGENDDHEKNGRDENGSNGFHNKDNIENPPKPLPRKSLSEQGSLLEYDNFAFPKPKPRTATASYKTRLGPKPFSCDNTEVSFDKVFAVPSAPVDFKPAVVKAEEIVHKNGKDEKHFEEEEKTPSESEEVEEKPKIDESDGKINKIAIADRKKLYERSTSLIEETKPKSAILERHESLKDDAKIRSNGNGAKKANLNNKRTSTVFGKVSKFRHLKGTTGHKSTHIENIKNISRQISGECDGFHANFERVAVPLSGSGGKIAVFELSKPGKLPDGVIPTLVNGSNIMDFQWNPFNPKELIVACDDGIIKIWAIPEGGLKESTNEPDREFNAHNEKIHFIKFHPLARDVLLTASYDMTIKLWNLKTLELQICLKGHTEQIFSFAWSSCGKYGATVSRDQKLRIYEPRKSDTPIREGVGGPVGTRGGRIMFALDDEFLVVTGFDKGSERQIYMFRINNLNTAIGMVGLDVSPAILVPFYDEDSSTIFVTGRGDTTIYAYEVTDEAPYFCPLSHHRCSSLHQGLSFLPKNQCDVRGVEFAKCLRLTNNSIEPLSFTVPRLKTEFFQDDLFPPTKVTWQETLGSTEWFEGKSVNAMRLCLKPDDMENLSATNAIQTPPPIRAQTAKIEIQDPSPTHTTSLFASDAAKAKQNALKKSLNDKVKILYDELEQDSMEGVEEKEWEE